MVVRGGSIEVSVLCHSVASVHIRTISTGDMAGEGTQYQLAHLDEAP